MKCERSPELRALENKYRKLRAQQPPVTVTEPIMGGSSLSSFVALSTEVVEEYVPGQAFVTAPLFD